MAGTTRDEDLYAGYDATTPSPDPGATAFAGKRGPPLGTAAGAPRVQPGGGFIPPPSAMARHADVTGSGGLGGGRPMTSNRGAGYTSRPPATGALAAPGGRAAFDPMALGARGGVGAPRIERSAEARARDMELAANEALEESAALAGQGNLAGALDKAKEAVKRERALVRFLEEKGLAEAMQNTDLTFAVQFHLGDCLHRNGLLGEALSVYTQMLREGKAFQHPARVRINMGNVHFEQQEYAKAIKMWRMAVDQLPNTSKELRGQVQRNIALAFVRAGHMGDALQQFEQAMEHAPSHVAGFNLVVCAYAAGDKERMKAAFQMLLRGLDPVDVALDEESEETAFDPDAVDSLREELVRRRMAVSATVLRAARVLAPALGPTRAAGFEWAAGQLREMGMARLAGEVELCKAEALLGGRDFAGAVEILKSFERKDKDLRARAAGSLSSIAFMEGDLDAARRNADLALAADTYNAQALVARGNVMAAGGELEEALRQYERALEVEADCADALYNAGLVARKLALRDLSSGGELDPAAIDWTSLEHKWRSDRVREAMGRFKKLALLMPDAPDVHVQIALCYELTQFEGERRRQGVRSCVKWLEQASAQMFLGADPSLMVKLGGIHAAQQDEGKALRMFLDAYRVFPASMDVAVWLGVYYVKNNAYADALPFFEILAQLQPAEAKWELMAASCIRRSGDLPGAYRRYQAIHARHADNVECLRYLVDLGRELGFTNDEAKYADKLAKAQRAQAQADAAEQAQSGPGKRGKARGEEPLAPVSVNVGVKVQEEGDGERRGRGKGEEEDWTLGEDLLPM